MTNDASDLKQCDVYVVTVPTALNSEQQPDLGPAGGRVRNSWRASVVHG